MKLRLLVLLAAVSYAALAEAATVTYSTTTSQLCIGASGCGVATQTIGGGSGVTVTFNPVASNTVNANPTTFASLGTLQVSCVGGGTACGGQSLAGMNLYINLSQTVPSAGFGSFVGGVMKGTLSGTASSASITWSVPNTVTIGSIYYAILPTTSGLPPVSTGGGQMTIMGAISTQAPNLENTSCANADFLFPGIGRSQVVSSAAQRFYKVRVVQGRSYSLYSWAPTRTAGDGGAVVTTTAYTDSACSTVVPGAVTTAREPSLVVTSHTGSNVTVIPAFTGTMYVRVATDDVNGYTTDTLFQETTIFSPWFFIAGVYNAFAEIKNTTDGTISYTMTAYAKTGVACGSTTGSLSGNGSIAINIRSLGTCAATVSSGSVDVAFHGPPAAIIGNITTIDGVAGVSFDAPFTARMPWSTATR